MQITPHHVLEEFARAEYRKHFHVAPPKVYNAQALVSLGERRPLRWKRHGYSIPAISFHDGMSLMVCQQVLAEDADNQLALATARRFLHTVMEKPAHVRLLRLRPFRRISASEVIELIDQVLFVPDDAPMPASGNLRVIDMLDGFLEFVAHYPAFINDQGMPKSWALYQYGLRRLGRFAALEMLRNAQTFRVAQATDPAVWKEFDREMKSAGGLN